MEARERNEGHKLERRREEACAARLAERERLHNERVARQEETIKRLTRVIEAQGATITGLVQRLNYSEVKNVSDREALLAAIAERIQEAIAADREAHPQVQPIDSHAMAVQQQELEERRVAMIERMGTFQKIVYHIDRQPFLVQLGLIALGIATCAGTVYVLVYTSLGARLISLVSNPSSALPAVGGGVIGAVIGLGIAP